MTNEELARAMAAAVDDDGDDTRLAEAVAAMTEEQRRRSDENLRRWVERAQAALGKRPERAD